MVVTRNRRVQLQQCLTSLQNQSVRLRQIIVVDNGSTDRTGEMVRSEFPQVTYHGLAENLGSGGGYAEALRLGFETGAAWLWAIDDEVVLSPDVLKQMLSRVTAHPQRRDIVLPAELDPYTGRSVVYPAWYAPLIHRDVIEKIGLPRSDFFWYAADSEFFLRARRSGFKVLRVPDIVVVHNRGNPQTRLEKRHASRLYYQTRNTIFVRRHIHRGRHGLAYRLFRVLGRMVRIIFSLEPGKVRKCIMIGRGTLDGLRGRLGKTVEID